MMMAVLSIVVRLSKISGSMVGGFSMMFDDNNSLISGGVGSGVGSGAGSGSGSGFSTLVCIGVGVACVVGFQHSP